MATLTHKNSSSAKKEEIKMLFSYLKYWYVFVFSILAFVGLSYLYVSNATPYYKISSTLLIQNDFKGDGLLKGTAFSDLDMFHAARTVDNEMEVLRSRDLIYKTLSNLNLETKYTLDGEFTDKELYGNTLPIKVEVINLTPEAYQQKLRFEVKSDKIFSLSNQGKRVVYRFGQIINGPGYSIKVNKGPAFSNNFKPVGISFIDLYTMAERYSLADLKVLPIIKDANTIVISVLDVVPQRGVDILNNLISTYNNQNVESKNVVALNTIKFIDQRLDNLTGDLSLLEQDVENYKQKNRITSLGADADINLRTSGNYDAELSNSRIQIDLINSLDNYLSQSDSKYELVPSTIGLSDVTIINMINKYNDMQLDRQRLLNNNSANNPLVLNLNNQLTNLKNSLQENLRNVRRGFILERNNLQAKSNQFESIIRNVPVVERGLLERTREQSVKANIYEYLLQKREETALSLSATIPSSLMVDKPAYSTNPAKPKSALIYVCSVLLGLLFPLSFIYGRDKLNTKVKDVSDVQLSGNARILGELSHKLENHTVVINKGSRTTISELFRYIRSNLGYINKGIKNQVLLVTSGMKGEGKTFFCINLGATLAMVDKKVVIVEFDLRKPDLIKGINMKYEKGLTEYLNDESTDLDVLIKPSGISPNLSVLGCGKLPDDPTNLLLSDKIEGLFEKLRKKFDYVIVDTSPVGLVSDAFDIAAYVDSSIYLIRYNYTEKLQLAVLDDICEHQKLKNLMIVFNDAKKENMRAYGYGGYAYETA
jgi:tyrosine-protein kinase Etk/Wzc